MKSGPLTAQGSPGASHGGCQSPGCSVPGASPVTLWWAESSQDRPPRTGGGGVRGGPGTRVGLRTGFSAPGLKSGGSGLDRPQGCRYGNPREARALASGAGHQLQGYFCNCYASLSRGRMCGTACLLPPLGEQGSVGQEPGPPCVGPPPTCTGSQTGVHPLLTQVLQGAPRRKKCESCGPG